MNDPLFESQASLALNFPLQTMCFIVGGLLVFVGLGMTAIFRSGRWTVRGAHLLIAGVLIAFPAVAPMILFITGGDGNEIAIFPTWFLPSAYTLFALLGGCVGIYGWFIAHKNKKTSDQS